MSTEQINLYFKISLSLVYGGTIFFLSSGTNLARHNHVYNEHIWSKIEILHGAQEIKVAQPFITVQSTKSY